MQAQTQQELIRINSVIERTGWSRSSIYLGARAGTFPKPVKIGKRASAWIREEVDAWIDGRITDSRKAA